MPPVAVPHARPATALPDMELAARAAAGDRGAFGELARRHVAAVRTLLRRMGADASLADRVAQDTFLASFARMDELRGAGPFSAWIRRLGAQIYIKRWLKTGRLVDASGTPAGEAAAKAFGLDEALAALPECARLCASLCYGAGLSHADSAQAFGAPVATVKANIRLGARALRRALAAVADESSADFDHRLHRLYAEAPPALDASLFAHQLEHRLDRTWAARRIAIALAGAASALAAVWSVAGSGGATQFWEALRSPFLWSAHKFGRSLSEAPLLRMLPLSSEVAWMLAGLVLLAAGLLATRAFDD